MRLHEALDINLFARAWQLILAQHEILRTCFDWEGNTTPQQLVKKHVELPITVSDLCTLDQAEQLAAINKLRHTDRFTPFDVSQAPLMRVHIAQLANDDYFVLWTFHHILLDGRSFPLLLQQLFATYAALVATGEPRALPVTRPFGAYITWREGEDSEQSQAYWQKHLAGFTAKSAIDFGAAAQGTGEKWGEVELLVSAENSTALSNFATANSVTLHTLLQAAWSLLLHHFSSEDEIVFASTRACRHWADDAADMIGLFINTVPMRVQVTADQSLHSYLQALRQQQIDLRQHEHTGLDDIQRWSDIARGETLFDSLVVYDNATLHERMRALGGDFTQREFWYHGQTNFPITILAYGGKQVLLRIEHQLSRFSAEVGQNILDQLHTVLLNMLGQATQPALAIPYLSTRDQQQLFSQWNQPVANAPTWAIHDKISAQAKITPHKVAVLTPANANMRRSGPTLTYQELELESTQLSRHLRQLGVKKHTLVGICLQRNANMVVAMLAVLKSGAAYVPIDPEYPRDRIKHMLDDSAARVVITDRVSYGKIPENPDLTILAIDNLESLTLSFYHPVKVQPSDLAYVIYTSGSTGKPKGVQVPHGALSNFLASMQKQPGLTADDVMLAVTTVSFDIAALELFLPLMSGATLCLASANMVADGHELAQTINNEPITIMQATPATWRMLLEAHWQGKPTLKILCGGEPLPRRLADQLLSRGRTVWNMYGPTETTIWSTVSQVHNDGAPITIGKAIDNTTCFILDKQQQPVPMGVIGELVIGGTGVTDGYKNRPHLTNEKFITDTLTPLSSAEAKLYRTGDLARYNPDGTLECLGRVDHQVKIRGFRIELGEIESVLSQHEAIADACVIAREQQPGVKHLVAYLIPKNELPPISTLRKFSKTKLPDYMIPATFITLESFPLTNNGKIDRLALPEPDGSRPELEQPFVPPSTETEQAIARIWQGILLVDRVGIHDSFFELGGDSLLVVRTIAQMRRHFKRKLSVHKLYEHRTISEFAAYLSNSTKKTSKLNGNIDDRAKKRRLALKHNRQRRTRS